VTVQGCHLPWDALRAPWDTLGKDWYRPPVLFADDPLAIELSVTSREKYIKHGRLIDPRLELYEPQNTKYEKDKTDTQQTTPLKIYLYDVATGRHKINGSNGPEDMRTARNLLQDRLIAKSNGSISKHLSNITSVEDGVNVALGGGALIFDGLGAVLTGGSTSQIMSVVSGGLTSTKSLIAEEVYQEVFAPLIIEAIMLARRERLVEIKARQNEGVSDYNVEAAIADVVEYHEMGGFYYGITLVQKQAAERQRDIAEKIKDSQEAKLKEINAMKSQINDSHKQYIANQPEGIVFTQAANQLGYTAVSDALVDNDLEKLEAFVVILKSNKLLDQ